MKLPLLRAAGDAPFAWREGAPITAREYLAHAHALAERLSSPTVVNLCEDRYHFLVAFAAAALRGGCSLLPPSRAEQAVADARAGHPGAVVIDDAQVTAAIAESKSRAAPAEPPVLPAAQRVAMLYTSGSTGRPTGHAKTWAELHDGAQRQFARLPFADGPAHLLATVPPQHMYGLENTVMLPLVAGVVVDAARPFFPADVRARLAALPAPRALVTTPLHLKACLDAGLSDWPQIDFLLSATAPLPPGLAARAEAALNAPLLEIYGSTESGAVATRRPAKEESWLPLTGASVVACGDGALARGGPYSPAVRLADRVEVAADGRFRLLGRNAELIKVAGKRASLAELNHRLATIEGVEDGAFVQPEEEGRLAALVVAPELSEQELMERLRRVLDPVFLPRPLVKVDHLPRNETGKLPRLALLALLAGESRVSPDHPALPGHFPGNPIVPGVVLLDRVREAAVAELPGRRLVKVTSVKFLRPLRPGQGFRVALERQDEDTLRFRCLTADSELAAGVLKFARVEA